MFEALRERDFRLLFTGQTFSLIGSSITTVALAFAVLEISPHRLRRRLRHRRGRRSRAAGGLPAGRRRVGRPPPAPVGDAGLRRSALRLPGGHGLAAAHPPGDHLGARRPAVRARHRRGVLPPGADRPHAAHGQRRASAAGQRPAGADRQSRRDARRRHGRRAGGGHRLGLGDRPRQPLLPGERRLSVGAARPRPGDLCDVRLAGGRRERSHGGPRRRRRRSCRRASAGGEDRQLPARPARRLARVPLAHLAVGHGLRGGCVPPADHRAAHGARPLRRQALASAGRPPGAPSWPRTASAR